MDIFWGLILFCAGGIAGWAGGWVMGMSMGLRTPEEPLPNWVNHVVEPDLATMAEYWMDHQHLLLSEFEVEE